MRRCRRKINDPRLHHRDLKASTMTRIPLLLFLVVSMFTGCSAFQSPNSSLGTPGANAVTVGKWRVEARGKFLNGGTVEVQVDLNIQKVGDPTKTIATPSIIIVVGQDAVVTISGNGADVTCSVSAVREESRVIVTVSTVISQDGSSVAKPMLRFPIDY